MANILFSDVSAGYDGITADDLPPDPTDGSAQGWRGRYKRQTEKLQAQQESRAAKA
ncbi:transporter, bile acid/Na+ symporter family [Salmonella enterica subsp. enterica]|uniref:Transporter, bile acid/Na+ symporter family n=1 Tax=Salmonella enterica I TaxID=59201 RepID=A0A3S4LW12_SALET|nr:transporter, bile acid/Na+ symporter family [Salmonella enterica subsp. enterica]